MKLTQLLIERAVASTPRIAHLISKTNGMAAELYKLGQSVLQISKLVHNHSIMLQQQQEMLAALSIVNNKLLKGLSDNVMDVGLPSLSKTQGSTNKPN